MTKKSGLLAAVLAALFLFGSALPSKAADRDDEKCHRRVEKAEQSLDRAVKRHGEHSAQAEKRRHHLEAVRERCGHDHDRDHDHH
jgi:hypothetical protein